MKAYQTRIVPEKDYFNVEVKILVKIPTGSYQLAVEIQQNLIDSTKRVVFPPYCYKGIIE